MYLNDKIEKKLIGSNSRNACTTYRQKFIAELLYFHNDQFSEDYTLLHTSYKDSVAGLLIEKYNELLKPYNIFKTIGIYKFYKNKTIDADELLEIKKVTYYILRNYYNNYIMPVLQKLNDDPSGKYNVYPIIGFKFKPLKDRSHLII